ncbi:hypothetical protein PYW07_005959 [Mythimna separata]|uniref:beta-N-acetylhexosaminidase n=1 Tax=Mythimna separata TaxID=271217 RepID=A0AAD7YJS6_MYTSE|nr:hypothetical protein PYW07_005959 [Mythimna separata]
MWLVTQDFPNNIPFLLYLLALKTIVCQTVTKSPLPLWNWECIDEKCLPLRATQVSKLQSLETCNMLCSSMQIWPQPTGVVSLSTTAVPLRADMVQLRKVQAPSGKVHELLQDAFSLFREDLRLIENEVRGYEEWRSLSLRIVVNGSGDPRMRLDTDESYSLSLRPAAETDLAGVLIADINARSFCGARHAMETLSQLVWLDPYMGTLLILEAARIDDAPRFRYRGLLVDTAHNYFPISELMMNIDAMAASKLNTFHWHISDSQAFPLHTNSDPELANYGAHTPGDIYTPEDVRAVVRRARMRGIRVLIEIDAPAHVGHAWSWGPVRNVAWAQSYVSGIRTIMSNEDAWDLNTGSGAWYEENSGAPYNSWQRVYEHRPWVKHAAGIVEGGEATVWSALLSEGGLIARAWPRAAALAERLWTDRPEGATRPVHARLDAHRSRLIARGIRPTPMWSMWCTHNTLTCG